MSNGPWSLIRLAGLLLGPLVAFGRLRLHAARVLKGV
jgi:hypothetical protein